MEALPPFWGTPTSLWTACLGAVLIFTLLSYLSAQSRRYSPTNSKKIPRIFYDPAIRAIFTGSLGNLPALHSCYGDLIHLTFIGEPAILVGGLPNIRAVLTNDNFQADLPKPMVKLLGQGNLQTVHGKEHARDRKILSPIFTPTNLKGYIPRVAILAKNTVKSWEIASTNNTCGKNTSILAYTEIRKYVLRVGLELVLGFDVTRTSTSEYDRMSQLFTDLWAGFFTVPVDVPGSNYRKALKARDELQKTILSNLEVLMEEESLAMASSEKIKEEEKINEEVGNEGNTVGGGGRAALELLMEAKDEDGKPVTKDHIMTLVTSLMLGALDTTATSLMLAVRRLALHPEVFSKARAEQADIIAQHGPDFTFDTLRHMRYLDGILKETIRLQSPVQLVFRRAVRDCEIGGGYLIPAGRKILVHVGEAIVNDERWLRSSDNKNNADTSTIKKKITRGGAPIEKNATNDELSLAYGGKQQLLSDDTSTTTKTTSFTKDSFMPERWLSDQGAKTGGWLPFGGGPRLCPGQQLAWTEMKLLLATLARGYTVELIDPNEKWDVFPLQKPKQGMPIRVTRKNG
ncbi:hypothetical protein Ndes2437B_g05074 [Nannochloris sp. 'desiccata']